MLLIHQSSERAGRIYYKMVSLVETNKQIKTVKEKISNTDYHKHKT